MIFVSFSAAALVAKRRHFLYLGGILASAISVLCTLRMLNFFMGGTLSAGLFAVELYGGLAIFMSYIIFDTQVFVWTCVGEQRKSTPAEMNAQPGADAATVVLFC
jgi:hypothetical protein